MGDDCLLGHEALFISVVDDDHVLGAAQLLFDPPYAIDQVFPGCIAWDGRTPCEVTLFALDHGQQRSFLDRPAGVFNALIEATYRCCLGKRSRSVRRDQSR